MAESYQMTLLTPCLDVTNLATVESLILLANTWQHPFSKHEYRHCKGRTVNSKPEEAQSKKEDSCSYPLGPPRNHRTL